MNRLPNPARGEIGFVIGEAQHILRPSFENLVAAEEELGPLFALVERASEGVLTLTEMRALIWHCLPTENRPAQEKVGEALLAMGLVGATGPVRAILSQVLQGRR